MTQHHEHISSLYEPIKRISQINMTNAETKINEKGRIMRISYDAAALWFDIANGFLVAGLIVTLLATFAIYWLGNIKEEYSQERTIKLENETAKANAQAVEAKLELEKYKAPRSLNQQEQNKIISSLNKYMGQEYSITPYSDSPESLNFSNQLQQSLLKAGWIYIKPENFTFPFPGVVGVQIYTHPDSKQSTKDAANALISILMNLGKTATPKFQGKDTPVTNQISLIVGTKQ